MSEEKPISPYGEGGETTKVITWRDGGFIFREEIDISLNGNTGLTKTFTAQVESSPGNLLGGLVVYDLFDENNSNLLELANNKRDSEYSDGMEEVKEKVIATGNEDAFIEGLNKNGTYDAVYGDESIVNVDNNVGDSERNNQLEIKQDAEENARLEEFKKSIEVSDKDHKYPIDMKSDEGQDYIFFEQLEYLPPQNTARPQSGEALSLDIGTTLEGGAQRGRNVSDDKYKRHGSCKLPIPNKLGVSNGVNWGEARANAVELSAFNSADTAIQNTIKDGNLLKLLGDAKNQAGDALNVLKTDLSGRTERSGNNINAGDILSATLARSVLGTIGINVDIDQFITRQTGAAINPNLELLFGGPQLRTFSFNFTFAPNSSREAKEVREIQRWFRQGMLPSRKRANQSSGSALFLASPNVFRIAYKNKNRRIKGLNIIKICALTSCQIDFTPDGTYQSYDDVDGVSMPVRSTMGVSFTELTPVFKDDYSDKLESPSMKDLGLNVKGKNAIDENDIGL